MEHVPGSDYPPVYHNDLEGYASVIGIAPRLFALIQSFDEVDAELVAYGIALPDGTAATIGPHGRGVGHWADPARAAARFASDLVWLAPAR